MSAVSSVASQSLRASFMSEAVFVPDPSVSAAAAEEEGLAARSTLASFRESQP